MHLILPLCPLGSNKYGNIVVHSLATYLHAASNLICIYLLLLSYKYFQFAADPFHDRWVPCHHGRACPQVADGGDGIQIRREAANILNKQFRRAKKGWSSSWGVGHGAKNALP
jgi:hypothetical protein